MSYIKFRKNFFLLRALTINKLSPRLASPTANVKNNIIKEEELAKVP